MLGKLQAAQQSEREALDEVRQVEARAAEQLCVPAMHSLTSEHRKPSPV